MSCSSNSSSRVWACVTLGKYHARTSAFQAVCCCSAFLKKRREVPHGEVTVTVCRDNRAAFSGYASMAIHSWLCLCLRECLSTPVSEMVRVRGADGSRLAHQGECRFAIIRTSTGIVQPSAFPFRWLERGRAIASALTGTQRDNVNIGWHCDMAVWTGQASPNVYAPPRDQVMLLMPRILGVKLAEISRPLQTVPNQ